MLAVAAIFAVPGHRGFIIAALLWWAGAIFDASDGDLARFTCNQTSFGGWLDSFFDRVKEFMIFPAFAYVVWKTYGNVFWITAGTLSAFACVMSGYISDTRKILNNGKRIPQVRVTRKFLLGMVDTRDFFVIVALLLFDLRIALVLYSSFFVCALCIQFVLIVRQFGFEKDADRR